jgi:hypothetical protein
LPAKSPQFAAAAAVLASNATALREMRCTTFSLMAPFFAEQLLYSNKPRG